MFQCGRHCQPSEAYNGDGDCPRCPGRLVPLPVNRDAWPPKSPTLYGFSGTSEVCGACGLRLIIGIDYPHRCEDRFPEYMRLDPSHGWSLTVGG